MATFSITEQPVELTPAYNQVRISIDSDLDIKDNFLYKIYLNINGSFNGQLKVATSPDGVGFTDIQRRLAEYVTGDFDPNRNSISKIPNSFATYSATFSMIFRDEWRFEDNFASSGNVGFYNTSVDNHFEVGDEVFIEQDSPFTFSQYEGVATVTDAGTTASLGNFIVVDKAFQGNTPANPGTASLHNFGLFEVAATPSISKKFVFNGRLDWSDYMDYDYTDYVLGTSSPGKFFSNVPDNYVVDEDDRCWLNVYSNTDGSANALRIETNNGTYDIINSFTSSSTDDNHRLMQVPCGPYNIDAATLSVVSGATPSFDTTTSTYSFYMVDSNGDRTSEIKTFKYDDYVCTDLPLHRVIFLDKLGSYVPFDFTLKDERKLNVNRKTYTQHYGDYNNGNWTYNTYDRGEKSMGNIWNKEYTLRSNYISESKNDYLEELIYSPDVYWINPDDDKIYAINIKSSNYKPNRRDYGLIRFDITFELSNKNYTQN